MSTTLYVLVCAAGPAAQVGELVEEAHQRGWAVQVLATPAALEFIDAEALATQTGHPVRSAWRHPGQARSPKANAIIVAPASFNTINKIASGIADTYAHSVVAEAIGMGIPTVILPFVNTAFARRAPFQRSVQALREEGIPVLLGPGAFQPHPPGTGGDQLDSFPWKQALDELDAP